MFRRWSCISVIINIRESNNSGNACVRDGYEIAELIFPEESPRKSRPRIHPSIFIFHRRREKCRTTYLAVPINGPENRPPVAFSAD